MPDPNPIRRAADPAMTVTHWVLTGSLDAADLGQAVPRWLRLARQAAARDGLTGGLLFDGERWAALLEGDPGPVARLVHPLRHGGALGVLHCAVHAASPAPRRCTDWRSGYVEPTAIDAVRLALERSLDAGTDAMVVALRAADTL